MNHFFERVLFRILKNFFAINLSATERDIAIDSVRLKYTPAIVKSFLLSLLLLPGVFFLDSSILVSVLIPITMVSGTAWFAVSLANIRKKFEGFGNELTRDLFSSFVLSLFALFLITISSMLPTLQEGLQHAFAGSSLVH